MKGEKYKIYKNGNSSSIIDYIENNPSTNDNVQPINSHMIKYSRKRRRLYNQPKYESKINSPKVTQLNTVFEKIIKDEESSSFDSKINEEFNPTKSHKNLLNKYQNLNINNQFTNNNINYYNKIYSSSNKIYNYKNYKLNKNNIGNKNFMSIHWVDENKKDKYNNFKEDIYSYKDLSKSFISSIDGDPSEFSLNKNQISDDEKKLYENINIFKNKYSPKNSKNIKIKFYIIISAFYFSLYLLCLKISIKLSMPKIPSLGVSSFIISFNNFFLSVLFIKLDQINCNEHFNFDKFHIYILKILINYLSILLTIKSLQYLNLLSFIIIINMTPLIVSYFTIRENNKSYKPSDLIYYCFFILIYISEFIVYNKISMLSISILIILKTFTIYTKITKTKTIHSYLIDLGCSIVGIAISPIIMSINKDYLNISISQYLLFIIVCFTYFLYHYFESKFNYYSFGNGFQVFSNIIIVCLYILYSNFLLRENNHIISYLFLGLSFAINIYGKLRIESCNY